MAGKKLDIKILTEKIIGFRDARDWKQFHNPKDVALSLVLEAAEVMEHFQWKSEKEIKKHLKEEKEELAEELADTLFYLLVMCHDLEIDLLKALDKKMKKNEKRYPVEKSKGKHTKYNKL